MADEQQHNTGTLRWAKKDFINLITEASVVLVHVFRVDVVAGFLKGIAQATAPHGHQVHSVLKGQDIEEVVVEDVADLWRMIKV